MSSTFAVRRSKQERGEPSGVLSVPLFSDFELRSSNIEPSLQSHLGLSFRFGRGAFADYLGLAERHYLSGRPATVHSVWTMRAGMTRGAGPLWRTGGYPRVAAVAVVSYPPLRSAARDEATCGRYFTPPNVRVGLSRLNREVLTISRVIVHPLYRGLGLSTRLVRRVLGSLDAPLIEAFARMGAYVPFFARAGMNELRLADRPVYYWRRKTALRRK
ncbi:MAG: hypothetical protein BIFFINMI_02930 [Phycisphaerae bacterium]|nr:hypothetical protein [Phycisphaerae bacterium]